MTSSRPAEYGFGDWQARNAACGAEFIRFRAICGHFGTNSTARTSISQPGVTLTPSPARHTWSTPSPTASPPPAPAGAPRLAFSVEARRRPADIRESSKFDTTPKIRRTIDSHHHGEPLVASASENSSMRRRMAASLNRPSAWRRRGLARTAFPGAEELAADGPWVGCGSATRAGSRGCRCARGAAAARSACHCPVLLELSHSESLKSSHRRGSFRPDALPTRSWSRAPGGRTL